MESSRTFIAVPSGETIKEQLALRAMSQKEFAFRMGLTEKHVTNLLKGSVRLTTNTAMRLESVLGIPAIFWENLEALYRESLIRVEKENLTDSDIEAAKKFPYSEMVRHGWILPAKNAYERVSNLRKYFEVSTLRLIDNPQINRIACRRRLHDDKNDYALLAWAQRAKIEARNRETKAININGLKEIIPEIRALNTFPPEVFCPKLIELFSDKGVALIFLPLIKNSFIHGASFYDGKKIVVGLTVSGKYADVFWFSLSHEITHIIYGHIGQVNGTSDEDEKDADSFAGEMLIPSKALNQFIREGKYDITALSRFAEQVDVDVGILVGRLQHDRVINYSQFNNLRKIYQLDKKIGGA